jgi:hypothetical protein
MHQAGAPGRERLLGPEALRDRADQARLQTPRRHRAGDRPAQEQPIAWAAIISPMRLATPSTPCPPPSAITSASRLAEVHLLLKILSALTLAAQFHEDTGSLTAAYSHGYPPELKRTFLEKWADQIEVGYEDKAEHDAQCRPSYIVYGSYTNGA